MLAIYALHDFVTPVLQHTLQQQIADIVLSWPTLSLTIAFLGFLSFAPNKETKDDVDIRSEVSFDREILVCQ